jgi:hypothetical protein
MHPYSSDAHDRKTAPALLGIAAVVLTWGFSRVLEITGVAVPWWIGTPTVMGLYALLWSTYDAVGWCVRIGPVRLSSIPDLRGTWVGMVTSSHDGGSQKLAVLWIQQRWSRIRVCLETEHSRSRSIMAALCLEEESQPGLRYEFLNEPRALSNRRMHAHLGTAHLRVDLVAAKLSGDYYTGRDRGNVGQLEFERRSTAEISFAEATETTTGG